MDNTLIIIIVVLVVVILGVILGLVFSRRNRSERLQEHFGSEYDRTVQTMGGEKKAQTELNERQKHVEALDIRPLSVSERDRPVEDCRYIELQPIVPGIWTRIRIPLKDLNANSRLLQRVSIGNRSDQPFTFYMDEVRLVGARWKNFLPITLKL